MKAGVEEEGDREGEGEREGSDMSEAEREEGGERTTAVF
jgi:hypothetical protein